MDGDDPRTHRAFGATEIALDLANELSSLSSTREVAPYLWLLSAVERRAMRVYLSDVDEDWKHDAADIVGIIKQEGIVNNTQSWNEFVEHWWYIKENKGAGSTWAAGQGMEAPDPG